MSFASLNQSGRNSVHRNHSVGSCIAALLLARCPSTVSWLIISRILFSIKRLSVGPRAHVGKEVSKRVPFFAYPNASPAISRIISGVGIVAALTHIDPRSIGSGIVHAVDRVCLFSAPARISITVMAAAFRAPRSKIGAKNLSLDAATTNAKPKFSAKRIDNSPFAVLFHSMMISHTETCAYA